MSGGGTRRDYFDRNWQHKIIGRHEYVEDTYISGDEVLSPVVDARLAAGGILMMPNGWDTANIGFKVCDTAAGTFLPLRNEFDTLVQIDSPDVDQAYDMPSETFAAHYIKLWSVTSNGTDVSQAAQRLITIMFKT